MGSLVLLICAVSTWFMTGLIWFVQFVHYPLFDRVGRAEFRDYHEAHSRLTTRIVIVPMILELATSAVLVVRPAVGPSPFLAWAGLAAAVICWASTGWIQVPLHGRLALGYDVSSWRMLVNTNAIRTVAWTFHAVIVTIMLAGLISTNSVSTTNRTWAPPGASPVPSRSALSSLAESMPAGPVRHAGGSPAPLRGLLLEVLGHGQIRLSAVYAARTHWPARWGSRWTGKNRANY
jgi:hypothetical protein